MFPKKIEIPTQTILRWLNKDSSKESLAAHVDRVFSGAHPTISHIEGMVTPFFPLDLRAAKS